MTELMNISNQMTLLDTVPAADRLKPVKNPPTPRGEIIKWLSRSGHYSGNKPQGGLWTSTYTPLSEDGCRSDWERGLKINLLIQIACPASAANLPAWEIQLSPQARVLTVNTLEEALAFTKKYHLLQFARPKQIRGGIGKLVTTLITDWERAFKEFDGIHLTEQGCDEVTHHKIENGGQTAFDTWHCESTLWGRWCFEAVNSLVSVIYLDSAPEQIAVNCQAPDVRRDMNKPQPKEDQSFIPIIAASVDAETADASTDPGTLSWTAGKDQTFTLGNVVATSGAFAAISRNEIIAGLHRHSAGDWGDVCDEDKTANAVSLVKGWRLVSAYHSAAGRAFWIITEADRSRTTVLLPEEY